MNLPSDIFVVTEAPMRKKPALKRFLEAYRDSTAWMIAKPEEAAKSRYRAINGRDEAFNLGIIKLRNSRPCRRPRSQGARPLRSGADAERRRHLQPVRAYHEADRHFQVVNSDLIPQ